MTKKALIKYLDTQNCYEFLYASYTDYSGFDVVLPSSVVENLRRIERTQEDEQVTAVWHLYLVEPEEYTAVRFNKVVEIPFSTDRLLADIKSQYDKYSEVDSLDDIPYVISVKLIERYDRDDYGAEAHRIFKVTIDNGEKHIVKIDGYYSSYNGFELETVKIVKPVEKTVIVYE